MQQVFLNILNNAYDAVQESSERGRITIRTCHHDNAIEVNITDNGIGIVDPQRIFDPFYTQSVSLVDYLSKEKGPKAFAAFLRDPF